jgi:hypothetical protein
LKITNFIVIEILKASRVAWELNVEKPVESCAIYISHTFPKRFGGYTQYGDSGAGPSGGYQEGYTPRGRGGYP